METKATMRLNSPTDGCGRLLPKSVASSIWEGQTPPFTKGDDSLFLKTAQHRKLRACPRSTCGRKVDAQSPIYASSCCTEDNPINPEFAEQRLPADTALRRMRSIALILSGLQVGKWRGREATKSELSNKKIESRLPGLYLTRRRLQLLLLFLSLCSALWYKPPLLLWNCTWRR